MNYLDAIGEPNGVLDLGKVGLKPGSQRGRDDGRPLQVGRAGEAVDAVLVFVKPVVAPFVPHEQEQQHAHGQPYG